jgi:hypothetical protein
MTSRRHGFKSRRGEPVAVGLATNPHWGFCPFPEPPSEGGEEGGSGGEEARRGTNARRRRRIAAAEGRVRVEPDERGGAVRGRGGAGPEQRNARRRVHRRRAATHARPATSTPPTRSEHHGLLSPLLAPVVLSALPVGVPSSRQSLGAPRRRLPMDDDASCPAGEAQGRGYPKPCAPGEPVRAGTWAALPG